MGLENAGLLRTLGIAVHEGLMLPFTPTEAHSNAFGTAHLAVLTALAEGAAWLAMGENAVPTSVTAHFVRPAKLGEPLSTAVRVVSRGKTLGVADADVVQGARPVAAFRVSFYYPPAESK